MHVLYHDAEWSLPSEPLEEPTSGIVQRALVDEPCSTITLVVESREQCKVTGHVPGVFAGGRDGLNEFPELPTRRRRRVVCRHPRRVAKRFR